jgi:hypothetical protein
LREVGLHLRELGNHNAAQLLTNQIASTQARPLSAVNEPLEEQRLPPRKIQVESRLAFSPESPERKNNTIILNAANIIIIAHAARTS